MASIERNELTLQHLEVVYGHDTAQELAQQAIAISMITGETWLLSLLRLAIELEEQTCPE